MDIRHVFIFVFMATAAFPLLVSSKDGCLLCSETKCPPLPSKCKNGIMLDRCGCCKICIPMVKQKHAGIKSEEYNDPMSKWLQSRSSHNDFVKPYLLEMSSQAPFLSNKPHSSISKTAKGSYEVGNIINNNKHFMMNVLNESSKRNLPQGSLDHKIGGEISGNGASTLVSLKNMPMIAKLDTDPQLENKHSKRSKMYQPAHKNEQLSRRMFEGLLTEVAGNVGESIVGGIGKIFSSVFNSVLQMPMKANASGNIHVENKPDTAYRRGLYNARRAHSGIKHVTKHRYKRQGPWQRFSTLSHKHVPFRYSRTFWPGYNIFSQILGYLREGILGIIKGTFGCIIHSLNENAAQDISHKKEPEQTYNILGAGMHFGPFRSKRSSDTNDLLQLKYDMSEQKDSYLRPSASEHERNKRAVLTTSMSLWGEKIGRATYYIIMRILGSVINFMSGLLSSWVSSMPQQNQGSWLYPQGFGYIWRNAASAFNQVLGIIGNVIHGIARNVFGCIMDSVNENTSQEGTSSNGRVYPQSSRYVQIHPRTFWIKQIERATCDVTLRVLRIIIHHIFELLSSLTSRGMPQQLYTTNSWLHPQNLIRKYAQWGKPRNFNKGSNRYKRSSDINTYRNVLPMPRQRRSLTNVKNDFENSKKVKKTTLADADKASKGLSYSNEESSPTKNLGKRAVRGGMSVDLGMELGKVVAGFITGFFSAISDNIRTPTNNEDIFPLYGRELQQRVPYHDVFSGVLGTMGKIGLNVVSGLARFFSSISGIVEENGAEDEPEENDGGIYHRSDGYYRPKRTASIDDNASPVEIEMIVKRSINEEETEKHLITKVLSITKNRNAAKAFSDTLAAGLNNIYEDLLATNLIKRATNGDLVSHVQQLCDALLYNNAELLCYITNNVLINISNMSSSLGSKTLINTKLFENSTELSEEGIKAYNTAMIAINVLTAPNVAQDFEELLNTIQDDAQLLLRKLFRTELLQGILTTELTQVIYKVTIPFIKFLGDVLKWLTHVLTDLSYDYTLNIKFSHYPVLPHANLKSVIDALLDRILTITESSVAETVYQVTQALLLEEINYIAETIRNDGFLGSIINIKYLSKVPKLTQKIGKIIVEKFANVLKIIVVSLHNLTQHVKNKDYSTIKYTSEVMAKLPNINKVAVLLQQFLNDLGKGSESILVEILQNDFISNKMNKDVTKLLLEKAHSLRHKAGKILVFLTEMLLVMLDYKITGSKDSISDILDDFLSSDIITLAYSALHSLDGMLSNNSQQLEKLGFFAERVLAQLTKSSLARTLFNTNILEYLFSTLHLYGKTINKLIGHAIYKGFNKIQHKYMKRINISDIEAKHEHIISQFIKSFTSETNIQSLNKLVKLTAINVGTVTANLLKSELVNQVINNETAVQLSNFALQSAYSLGDMLAAITEQAFNDTHILAGGVKQTGIHRPKRQSGMLLQSASDLVRQGFIVIMKGINFFTTPQIVEIINNLIVHIFKTAAKIIEFIVSTNMAKNLLTQDTANSIITFAEYLDEKGGKLLGAAISTVLNYIHKSTAASAVEISLDNIEAGAKQGLEMAGVLVSSITTQENIRIIQDFIHMLYEGLADITHEILNSALMKRIMATDFARSLATILEDIMIKTGNIRSWLLGISMKLIHYILEKLDFNNNVADRIHVPNTNNMLRSLLEFVQRVTAPEVVLDIVKLIRLVMEKSTDLAITLIKSELGMKVLKGELADAAVTFASALRQPGSNLLALLVQRIFSFTRDMTSKALTSLSSQNSFSGIATRMSINNVTNGFRKVSLLLMNLLLKVLSDKTISFLKFFIQVSFQGITTSLGSVINSGIGHYFLVPNFAEGIENFLISTGKLGGKIAGNIAECLLKLLRLGLQKLYSYINKEVGTRMMFDDLFNWVKQAIVSLTTPKMTHDLEQMILKIGRDGGYLLFNIFSSSFVNNFINSHFAERLAKAAPTITWKIAEVTAFVVKGIMNIIHSVLTGQGIPKLSLMPKQRTSFSEGSYPAIRVIFNIIKCISGADNARAIKDVVVIIGRSVGNTIKQILQSDLAYKMLKPDFVQRLANAAVFIGNKGGQVLGYLIELSLALINQIFVRGGHAQIRFQFSFNNIAQRSLVAAMYLLKRLTNPYTAKLLKTLIQDTFKHVGVIIASVLKTYFEKDILDPQLVTYVTDFILQMFFKGGEALGEVMEGIMEIIYNYLPQTNSGVVRGKRSTLDSSQWQMLSAAAMKGLRFLQEILVHLTDSANIAHLKNTIAYLGNETGTLIANIAESKYTSLILNTRLSKAIAEFARAVGQLGGKLIGETVAAALTHINYLIGSNMRQAVSTRTGLIFYKISSAGAKALEFIGKILSYISSPEITRLVKDFINILTAELADLIHDVLQSKLSKRLVGTDIALTLSKAFKEVVGKIGDIGTLILEKVMDLIHSLLEQFGISNIKLKDILPGEVLQSVAKLVKQMTEPHVIQELVELTQLVCNRVTAILVKLVKSNLAAQFLSPMLRNLIASMASVLGSSGGRIVSTYVKKMLNFINSALSSGKIATRSMNIGSNLASSFKKVLLFVTNQILKYINSGSIANIKTFTQYGTEKTMKFVASLLNSKMVHSVINPNFASQLQNGITNVAKYGGIIVSEILGKLLESLVFLARNIRDYVSQVGTRMSPWQRYNALLQPNLRYVGSQRQYPTQNSSQMMVRELAHMVLKQVNANLSKMFLNMYHFTNNH